MDSMTASDVPSLCKAVLASGADIGFEQSASLPAPASKRMMNRSPMLPPVTFCNQKRVCINSTVRRLSQPGYLGGSESADSGPESADSGPIVEGHNFAAQ